MLVSASCLLGRHCPWWGRPPHVRRRPWWWTELRPLQRHGLRYKLNKLTCTSLGKLSKTPPVPGNGSSSSEGIRSRRAAAEKLLRRRRAATSRPERMWPDGIIPYVISGNFSGDFWIWAVLSAHFFFFFFYKSLCENMPNLNCFQAASAPFSVRPCVTGRNTPVWRSQRGRPKRATSCSPTGLVGEPCLSDGWEETCL